MQGSPGRGGGRRRRREGGAGGRREAGTTVLLLLLHQYDQDWGVQALWGKGVKFHFIFHTGIFM